MPATRTRRTAKAEETETPTDDAQDANTEGAGSGETSEAVQEPGAPQTEREVTAAADLKDITININIKEAKSEKITEGQDIEEALKNAEVIPEEADNTQGDGGNAVASVKIEEPSTSEVKKTEEKDAGDAGVKKEETPAAGGEGQSKETVEEKGDKADEAKGDNSGDAAVADGGTEVKTEDSAADQDGKPSEPVSKEEKPEEEEDENETVPYPESFSKLHQLTVNIGPIKQRDLMSKELHSILNLTWDFEIKFEKKEKKDEDKPDSNPKQERLGSVRIPFTVNSPRFLINIAKKLGNLRIDGRDMSVKFPEVFNSAVKDCEEYLNKVNRLNAKQRIKRVELMKRQIIVRNVPEKVEEDTVKSMFPEACKVTLNTVDNDDGTKKVRSVLLDFESEKVCKEFLASNKDVHIGDCKVKLVWQFDDGRGPRSVTTASAKAARMRNNRGQAFRARMNANQKRGGRGGRASNAGPSKPQRSQSPSRQSRSSFSPSHGQGNQNQSRSRQGNQGRRQGGGGGGGGRGNQGFSNRNQGGRQDRGGRMDQASGGRGGDQDDDPVAMMNFLKNAMARVEEKIIQRSDIGGNYGGYGGGSSRNDRGSPGNQGGGRQRNQRKRKMSRGEQGGGGGGGYGGKRQFQQDRGMNYNDNSGRNSGRSSLNNSFTNRNSGGMGGSGFNDNFMGQNMGNMGNMMGQGNFFGNQGMNYGNRSATQGSGSYGYNNNNW